MEERILTVELTLTQAAIVCMALAKTATMMMGVVVVTEPSEEVLNEMTQIVEKLTDQFDGFPDATDVEEWLKQ
jgi:hypothetical protein